jgi:hypothetical protein
VFRVTDEAGDVDPLRVEADPVGQERPYLRQLLLLEVVAEAPVAEHLEEGRMPVVADLVDVLHAQAGLAVRDPRPGFMVRPEQVRQQRLHPAAGEQRGRVVVGYQGRARNDHVAGLGHVVEINPADVVGLHGRIPHQPGHPVEELASDPHQFAGTACRCGAPRANVGTSRGMRT